MAGENQYFTSTLQAGEDLTTLQYHAIALDDGKLANNPEEASGILLNKPNTGQHLSLAYVGELKFAAGAAITKGAKLTVTTSGWFTSAGSVDGIVGEIKETVTSGSIATGLFFFPTARYETEFVDRSYTPTIAIIEGVGVALDDGKCADAGREAAGVSLSAISSGIAGNIGLHGVFPIRMDPTLVSSTGNELTVTTSGYFTLLTSGYVGVARALTNVGCNALGAAFFVGGAGGYLEA